MPRSRAERVYAPLIGVTALVVLLQAVWAGIFLEHDGQRDSATAWLDAHSAGGIVALVLALASATVATVGLRPRRDLLAGAWLLTVLIAVEYMLGELIHHNGKDTLTAVHVPLGMLIMALVTWLPTRTRRPAAATAS